MSSQASRHLFPIAAATLMFAAGMSRTAVAKQCATSSDCDTGYQCSFATAGGGTGVATGGTAIPTPGSATSTPLPATDSPVPTPIDAGVRTPVLTVPDAGVPTPIPLTGTCVAKPIVCASAADCPADFECVKDIVARPQPACPPDTKCAEQPPEMSDTGTCQAVPHVCNVAADCPVPLVCQSQSANCSGGGSVGPDGVVTTIPETCTPGPSVCTYVPKACTADTDCADSYQCVKVSEGGMCSGEAPVCLRTDAGDSCSAPPPPVCETYAVMNCMPKQIACGAGQACPSNWSCFDFSNLSETVPGWSPDASGKSCLPDGLILLVQGHANGEGSITTYSGTAGGGRPGSTPTTLGVDNGQGGKGPSGDTATGSTTSPTPNGSVPPVTPAASGSDTGPTTETAGASATKVQGGGCAVGGGRAASVDLWLALALTGLVARVARRRGAARCRQ